MAPRHAISLPCIPVKGSLSNCAVDIRATAPLLPLERVMSLEKDILGWPRFTLSRACEQPNPIPDIHYIAGKSFGLWSRDTPPNINRLPP